MESGFSQIQEKLRTADQAHAATRLDLTNWRLDSEAGLAALNAAVLKIEADLAANRKEHEAFGHDLNANRLSLAKFEEATQLDLRAVGENHSSLRDAHERLAREVEEQNTINRDAQTMVGKELRGLASQADDIKRNLEVRWRGLCMLA
jgi:hypothetical protein